MNGTLQADGTISGKLSGAGTIDGSLAASGGISGVIQSGQTLNAALNGNSVIHGSVIPTASTFIYDGPYSYTPTSEQQVVAIQGKQATQDIIIAPIPSNYGLVAWNGAALTIS